MLNLNNEYFLTSDGSLNCTVMHRKPVDQTHWRIRRKVEAGEVVATRDVEWGHHRDIPSALRTMRQETVYNDSAVQVETFFYDLYATIREFEWCGGNVIPESEIEITPSWIVKYGEGNCAELKRLHVSDPTHHKSHGVAQSRWVTVGCYKHAADALLGYVEYGQLAALYTDNDLMPQLVVLHANAVAFIERFKATAKAAKREEVA